MNDITKWLILAKIESERIRLQWYVKHIKDTQKEMDQFTLDHNKILKRIEDLEEDLNNE